MTSAPAFLVGMRLETIEHLEWTIYGGKWPISATVDAGTSCLVTRAYEDWALIRFDFEPSPYPELEANSASWQRGFALHGGDAFSHRNGFNEYPFDREQWRKFKVSAAPVEYIEALRETLKREKGKWLNSAAIQLAGQELEDASRKVQEATMAARTECEFREMQIGDVLLWKAGEHTDKEINFHQMLAGETATIVELDSLGSFRLLDARGFISDFKSPVGYVFSGVAVSDSELQSALEKGERTARGILSAALKDGHKDAPDAWRAQRLGSRPKCKHGANCYRKNEAHKDEFCHPCDYDWNVSSLPGRGRPRHILTITAQERSVMVTNLAGEVLLEVRRTAPVTLGHIRKTIAKDGVCLVSADGVLMDGPDCEVFAATRPEQD